MSSGKQPTVISLYTGVGGLDFGFEAGGYRTAVAIEQDPAACRVLRENRNWPIIEDDIHRVSTADILSAAGLCPGEADVLVAGPPCQPFSKSGYWRNGTTGRLDDPRADTLGAFLRVLEEARPKSFVLENVYGIAFRGKDEALEYLMNGINRINKRQNTNYDFTYEKLNAAEYGVPQKRERIFLVGSLTGQPFRFPKPTHASAAVAKLRDLQSFTTAWDAIGDLPERLNDPSLVVNGKWGALLPTIPEGQNYLWHTDRGGGLPLFGWRTRFWTFLLKLKKDQPSWTIQAQPGTSTGPFHWANRRLSGKEMARLQNFPDIELNGTRAEAQRLIGNAVPSLLSEILAREIKHQILGISKKTISPTLGGTRRVPVPAAETPKALPAQYKSLMGEYGDHPGPGKGRGAQARSRLRARN